MPSIIIDGMNRRRVQQLNKVLFVCVGNACRSQMAEAIARHSASDIIEPSSAGVSPIGYIAEGTRSVLKERGIELGRQFSKSLQDESLPRIPDLIINMSGIPGRSLFPGGKVEDWDIEDPFGAGPDTFRRIRDDLESRVSSLADRLRYENIRRLRASI